MGKVTVGEWEFGSTTDPIATMQRMKKLIRRDSTNQQAVEAAISIVMTADGHNTFALANEIKEWAARHLHYIPDVDEMQVLKPPITLLNDAQTKGLFIGNCADAAMLCAMLCICVGVPCYLEARAFSKPNAPYQHVVTVAQTDHGLVDFDITKPDNIGDIVVSRRYDLKV